MNKYSNHDRYLDPATGVLLNKLGITDPAILEQQEADYAFVRSCQLAESPVSGTFDLAHLQAIHKALFSDLYEWAGELRTIDISKGESYFAHHAHIEYAAQSIFTNLAAENCLAGTDREQFSERAAYYLGEINALHPFREGNGRAQREFINYLAYQNDYSIEWKNITSEEMVQASMESFKGNIATLSALIHHNLVEGFTEGRNSAINNSRHEVEVAAYGWETTGHIEVQHGEPPVEPVSWAQATQDIAPPQIEPPEPIQELER